MKLKLDFPIQSSFKKIDLTDGIYLIGSCFSDEISNKLHANKFRTLSNPFGTIFNPYSTFKLLSGAIDPSDVIENQGVFYHWDAYSKIAALDADTLKKEIDDKLNESNEFLKKAKWIVITLGTAWAYRYRRSKNIVANCHKVDSSEFHRELLDIKFIVDSFRDFKMSITKINPYVNVIITVSPVRHVKDGLAENNRSKARLIEASHELGERFENVDYFPSYEILIDELRDYRFYQSDMIHPSPQAVDYIWSRFGETYFSNETFSFLKEWQKIKSSLAHKPFQPSSKAHLNFIKETISKMEKLNEKVDLEEEINRLRDQLK